jgi:hypothetical protein
VAPLIEPRGILRQVAQIVGKIGEGELGLCEQQIGARLADLGWTRLAGHGAGSAAALAQRGLRQTTGESGGDSVSISDHDLQRGNHLPHYPRLRIIEPDRAGEDSCWVAPIAPAPTSRLRESRQLRTVSAEIVTHAATRADARVCG